MRRLALALIAFVLAAPVAGCATAQGAAPAAPPDSIEVVYRPDVMFWSIEDGGLARFRTSEREDWRFTATHEEFVRIRDLLEPLREAGLTCGGSPADTGYIIWRTGGAEHRQPLATGCSAEAVLDLSRRANTAYRTMRDWGDARWEAAPGLADPRTMTLTWLYWGRTTSEWTVPRGGEARWSNEAGESRTFAVSEADFDRLRDIFRPYEGARFECDRVITDGPYGRLTWSQPGHEDQQLNWDAGCVTGDATDVFERVDRAEALLKGLRDGG